MHDVITALFDGIEQVLKQPAAAAIIASIVSIAGTMVVSRRSASDAARSAHLEYLRRRHDRFEDALVALATVIDDWASEEVALLNTYARSVPDTQDSTGERADPLRQQITNDLNRLRALAPYQPPKSPKSPLHHSLGKLETTWSESLSTRRYLEHAIGPWDLSDDEVSTAHHDGLNAVKRVEQAVEDLFTANTAYVQTSG